MSKGVRVSELRGSELRGSKQRRSKKTTEREDKIELVRESAQA